MGESRLEPRSVGDSATAEVPDHTEGVPQPASHSGQAQLASRCWCESAQGLEQASEPDSPHSFKPRDFPELCPGRAADVSMAIGVRTWGDPDLLTEGDPKLYTLVHA